MEEFRKKLNYLLRFHRQRRFGIRTSFATIDIPNTDKQISYMAGNKGHWVGLYHPPKDGSDEWLENLYSNKNE